MYRLGLKLWSTNEHYVNIAKELYDKNIYDYIELYAIPESLDKYIHLWQALDIPYIIHAPHFVHGINFSVKDKLQENIKLAYEALKYADYLNAEKVIFHPGINGDYRETARQLQLINDERILIENKPYHVAIQQKESSLNNICVGYSPEQIEYIMQKGQVGLCLDIGHGICAANSLQIDYISFLQDFINLKPKMYHISDGEAKGTIDKHYNINKGSFDFQKIFSIIPKGSTISIETEKTSKDNLDDFICDVRAIRGLDII